MNTKFVICTRRNSARIPDKPFRIINGKYLIQHLIDRLLPITDTVYLAVPPDDVSKYMELQSLYKGGVQVFCGSAEDPLKRMAECADAHNIDRVVRVTHDKIFIRTDQVLGAIRAMQYNGADYLFSNMFTDGTAFEIIAKEVLQEAVQKFKNVEHISYAAKAVAKSPQKYNPIEKPDDFRLLIDYPEDLTLIHVLLSSLGNNATYADVSNLLSRYPDLKKINKLPDVTVYTCSHNNADTIETTMESVLVQNLGGIDVEYILVDDHSNDGTTMRMAQALPYHQNVQFVRNEKNLGLAASSNVALSRARGKYIIRIDADDYFCKKNALKKMYDFMESNPHIDVAYPCYYDGSMHKVGHPESYHHPAGAMFKTRALNHVKFNEGLRHYDGLDLYMRAKDQLEMAYYLEPLFFYRHRDGSLSRSNEPEREETKKLIMENYGNPAT